MVEPSIRVLLVEDDEDDYLLIRDLLTDVREQRFHLDWVTTYDQAIQTLEQRPHDIYLVDYRLEARDGIELVEQVKQRYTHSPVIILSGQGDRALDISALRSGAADYLDKAYLQSSLLEHCIRVSIERNQARIALEQSQQKSQALYERENKLRQKLARSNAELAAFARAASHDLQEPLRAVAGHVELLQDKLLRAQAQDAETQEYLDFIADGIERMQTLVHDLLTYSRVETRDLELTEVDCHERVQAAIANLQTAIAESKAEITVRDLPSLTADATQLLQLFQNLLSNAIKFRRPDTPPQITIEAEPLDDQQWRFSMIDNGIGVDAKYCDLIFKIFKRLHTQQEFPGTGLGLALCQKVVERHGGKIWAEPQPEAGVAFHLVLPCHPFCTL